MNNETPKKSKGPIRWGAVLPFTIIILIVALGTHFFLDMELRAAASWGLTKAMGSEVNVGAVETSFWTAHLRVTDIEITDSEKPSHDSISIGEIRFGMLWDALLRAKVVVNEAVIEQIEFGKQRKSVGWVKPPEPPPVDDGKPSAMAQKAGEVKDAALKTVQNQYDGNVFGDIASVLGGGSSNLKVDELKEQLASKKMADEINAGIKVKETEWTARLKTLPQGEEFQKLGDRLKKVKTSGFKNPQELQQSLQELDSIFKESDAKVKAIQSASNDLNTDLAKINKDVATLQEQIKTDVKTLEARFHIPHIDAKALTMALFHKFAGKYLDKFQTYKALADKYIPVNVAKKGSAEPDLSMQPRPRAKGVSYEFGRPNSYPLFWIKHTAISSQAGKNPEAGNIRGEINDITTNQLLTGKPTVADVAGDFPGMGIIGLTSKLVIDNRSAESLIDLDMNIASYPVDGKELTDSPDVKIAFKKAIGTTSVKASLKGLKNFEARLNSKFTQVDYDISAKSSLLEELLKKIFVGIPTVTVDGHFSGTLPGINTDLESNLGPELQKGLEREVNAKIAATRAQIEKQVNDQVGAAKKQIDEQVAKLKAQVEGPLKKAQAQGDAEKKQVEGKTDQAKKDTENQAKKGVEDSAKKAAEDLKKKLGF